MQRQGTRFMAQDGTYGVYGLMERAGRQTGRDY